MKTLADILSQTPRATLLQGSADITLSGIRFDSRQVKPGDLFVALRGVQADGHLYLDQAVANGAAALVVEYLPQGFSTELPLVQTANNNEALGWIAAAFYNHPSRHLKLVAVTGTNGKTTTVTLLYQLVTALGYKAGLLSTVENRIGFQVLPASLTTPDAVYIQEKMAGMVASGCHFAFMEASSHAIHQRRIAGLQFAGAVFTNITHDHLDYHGAFQNYIAAKKMLFDDLPKEAFALVNIDDKRGPVMVQNTAARVQTYSLKKMADFRARILDFNIQGLHLQMDGVEMHARLTGAFNAYNLLAVYSVARLLGFSREEILPALSQLQAAPGRFETVEGSSKGITGIVDYAHTPDALEKVLAAIGEIRTKNSRILTVVGCGGDRDRAKRPVMAQTAVRKSDRVILTSDNPRSEDPEAILNEMEAGLETADRPRVLRISDRREAIRTACALAQKGDVVLVAGKGHEKYQEIKGVRYPFDDIAILQECLISQ